MLNMSQSMALCQETQKEGFGIILNTFLLSETLATDGPDGIGLQHEKILNQCFRSILFMYEKTYLSISLNFNTALTL